MKILFLHNTITPYRHPLFEQLARRFDLLVVYCSAKHNSRVWEIWPRSYNYKHTTLPGVTLGQSSFNPSIIVRLTSSKPDAVILSGYTDLTMWLALGAARLLRIPVVYWTEGVKEPASLLGKISKPLRLIFLKSASAIVVPGKISFDYVKQLGANSNDIFLAPNSIDNSLFFDKSKKFGAKRDELRNSLGFHNRVVILYVGRFVEQKGIKYLIEAFSSLRLEIENVALMLVGYGPQDAELKTTVSRIGGNNISIMPAAVGNDLVKLYCAADIFALPTLSDVWGFVVNEAMVCGLPVVGTSASQAVTEAVTSGHSGFVTKPADPHELYSALKALVENPEKRRRMSEEAVRTILERFGVEQTSSGFVQAIIHAKANESHMNGVSNRWIKLLSSKDRKSWTATTKISGVFLNTRTSY